MTTTPLTNVTSGQRFAPNAATWNAFVETARIVKGSAKNFAAEVFPWPQRECRRMVVIDRGTLGGEKENAALTPVETRYARSFFKAVILDDDSAPDVSDMQDPEKDTIVTVSGRFIASVLFTGQEFIGGSQVSSIPGSPYIECDVIQSPSNTNFVGVYRTGKDWNCEIQYNAVCGNANAKTQRVCPVQAANYTGQTLVDGQSVLVRLYGGLWVIDEFFCPDYQTGNDGNNGSNNPRTGGGYPLP